MAYLDLFEGYTLYLSCKIIQAQIRLREQERGESQIIGIW